MSLSCVASSLCCMIHWSLSKSDLLPQLTSLSSMYLSIACSVLLFTLSISKNPPPCNSDLAISSSNQWNLGHVLTSLYGSGIQDKGSTTLYSGAFTTSSRNQPTLIPTPFNAISSRYLYSFSGPHISSKSNSANESMILALVSDHTFQSLPVKLTAFLSL